MAYLVGNLLGRFIFTFKTLVLFCALAISFSAYPSGDSIKAEIDSHTKGLIEQLYQESKRLEKSPPFEAEEGCRWVDIESYKKENPFSRSAYESNINTCATSWLYGVENAWKGLDRAKGNSSEAYQKMVDYLLGLNSGLPENSPKATLVDLQLKLHASGVSLDNALREIYSTCIEWAEKDPDDLISAREQPNILSEKVIAIKRGYLQCSSDGA